MRVAHNRIDLPEAELRELYLDRGMSTVQLGQMFSVSDACITKNLRRYGIETRSIAEAKMRRAERHVRLSTEAVQFITGELLGDGCISLGRKNPHYEWIGYYCHASKHKLYMEWLSAKMASFGIRQSGSIISSEKSMVNKKLGTVHSSVTHAYKSVNYLELGELRREWYPGGKKVVRPWVDLSPIAVRQWYIGDGHLCKTSGSILFACHAFADAERQMLATKLSFQAGLVATAHKRNFVCVGRKWVPEFFRYIGECPEEIRPIYDYKWAWRANDPDRADRFAGGLMVQCRKGHPFDDENTYHGSDGKRHCRKCHAAREASRRQKLMKEFGLSWQQVRLFKRPTEHLALSKTVSDPLQSQT